MSVGWFTSASIDKPFTWCDHIGTGHPDPDIAFAEVTLRHDPGGPLPPLERFFGCPVRLGGGPDAIRFGPGVLDRETRLGDAAM